MEIVWVGACNGAGSKAAVVRRKVSYGAGEHRGVVVAASFTPTVMWTVIGVTLVE